MVEKLESRSAGMQLAAILAILVVPTMLMGAFFADQMRKDITLLDRELIGLQLAEQAFATLVSPTSATTPAQLAEVDRLEEALGITGPARFAAHLGMAEELAATSKTAGKLHAPVDPAEELAHSHDDGKISGYMNDVASTSGLILDSDEVSYHLVDMVVVNLSHVIVEVVELEQDIQNMVPGANMAPLIRLLGNIDEDFERYEDAMARAKSRSTTPAAFEALERKSIIIGQELDSLAQRVMSPMARDNAIVANSAAAELRSAAADVYKPALALIKHEIQQRRDGSFSKMIYLLAIGACAALTALGMAAFMFVRTFKKLDDLEAARKVAESMRVETERVNGEVAHLNRNLADKMARLEEAQGELIKKGRMEQLGQLTATIAHEIRNPLGAVRTSAFLIDRKLKGKGMGVEAQLERINKGVERCDSIITQLLDFSRTRQVETRTLNLDGWLEKTITEEAERIPAVVSLSCDLGLGDVDVPFDAARLRRAIVNLLNNASEAMVGQGDDPSKFTTLEPRIDVSTRLVGDSVELVVKDNGPGMPIDVLHKVREPLFTTKSFGTGLGVPAVEQIAIQHGGSLRISSSAGMGAVFTIVLPIAHEKKVAA
jgi:signal transduction histidine kinase